MLKIVADDKIPFLKGVLEPYAEMHYLPGGKITRNDLKDADALITRTRTICDETLLRGTSVKFIATATIGFDHIDADYCSAHDIAWTNAPGCNSTSVMQYLVSLLIREALRTNTPLNGMTLGVIGAGNVGSKVTAAAEALGMKVLINDPPRARKEGSGPFVPLEMILEKADFITCHVPLILSGEDATLHLADLEFFENARRKPFFINTSRGEVTDNPALKEALRRGLLRGAALDVWENEPEVDPELMDLLNYATPHIAGYSTDGKANGTAKSVNALSEFFGLGLSGFYPKNLPPPPFPRIDINAEEPQLEQIAQAVFAAYDILADDQRFRASPQTFEQQRGDYPLRREFSAYQVAAPQKDREIFRKLGFQQPEKETKCSII